MDSLSAPLVHNETLGRLIRAGGWAELAEGTPRLVQRAIESGRDEAAAALADFHLQEMRVVYDIYTQWFRDTGRFLIDKGMSSAELAVVRKSHLKKLAPYFTSATAAREVVWDEIAATMAEVGRVDAPRTARLALLEVAVSRWRDLHDCEVSQLAGLFHEVISRHGEPALREMYEGWVIGDWFAKRYQRFDISKMPWETASWLLVYLGFEGHHGHLSGAARDGTIDFAEDDETVTLSFAPCGSGGRSMQGEVRDGLPSLSAAPFGWGELEERHDFTWNEAGICSYCAHCCLLHEAMPIAAFGYPVRVTTPPAAPLTVESRCSWTVYKDLRSIPEAAYVRVGATKPPLDAPLGSAGRAQRDAMTAERVSRGEKSSG